MGTHEQELESIANGGKFDVPNFSAMRDSLDAMSSAINALLANSSGWKGDTAEAGKTMLLSLKSTYADVARLTLDLESVVGKANGAVDTAIERLHGLPASAVPSYVLNAVGTTVPFMGIDFPINGAVGKIASLLAAQREQVARSALDELERDLDVRKEQLKQVTDNLKPYQPEKNTGEATPPEVPATTPTIPGSGGPGGGSPSYAPWTPGVGISGPGGRAPSIDDPLTTGTVPGSGPTTGTPPWTGRPSPVPTPGPGGGGGIVPGLGGAAGAAGLAAAARMGVGAGGMGGMGGGAAGAGAAGARLGSGLSGSAGSGVGSAGAGAASGGAAGAGGRGGASSVMGGGGAGGGAPEKEKRSGLGGLIAPKLEDDEEIGPRSAAADAGGRDS